VAERLKPTAVSSIPYGGEFAFAFPGNKPPTVVAQGQLRHGELGVMGDGCTGLTAARVNDCDGIRAGDCHAMAIAAQNGMKVHERLGAETPDQPTGFHVPSFYFHRS
jgi:hypothetical protein